MGRKKKIKSNSWMTGKSQEESTTKRSSRSSSSLEIQTTLGNSQQHVAYHPVSPMDDFAEGRQPWIKLLFDVKTGQKCKSSSNKESFSKSSPVICSGLLLEPQDNSYKLSDLLGDVTFEDWSSQSYLILMTLRDGDNTGNGDEQLHDTEVSHLNMNKIPSNPKFESRPTVTSVLPLKELCQTALSSSHLKYKVRPASEIPEKLGSCVDRRRLETRQLSHSVPSLQDLSKIVVDRLHRVHTNTNSTCEKNLRSSSPSERSASILPAQQNPCEAVASALHQQRLLSKETERIVANMSSFEDTTPLNTIPSLQHLAEIAVKRENLSLRVQRSNMPSLEDSGQTYTVPSLRHLTEIAVKGLHLRSRDKMSNLPCLDDTIPFYTFPSRRHLAGIVVKTSGDQRYDMPGLEDSRQSYTVPSLRHLAGMVRNSLSLSFRVKRPTKSSFENPRQSCTIPSLHDLAEKVLKAGETGSIMPSFGNKRHTYTVPSLHDLTETLVKSLRLNSSEKVSTKSQSKSSGGSTLVTDHLFTVPSLRHLCQMVVDGLKYIPKEKKSPLPKTNETEQRMPSLLEIKVTRPRIQRQPKVPVSGFPLPMRAPMPQMNFNRPMFPMGFRHIGPRVRPPMAVHPFWRMNRPPPNFWPRRGACERYGVPHFEPRYGPF